MIKHTHYTAFGVTCAPELADACGFVAWRHNFQTLPQATWTPGERWIDAQDRPARRWKPRRIAAWRAMDY